MQQHATPVPPWLDCDVFAADWLHQADAEAVSAYDREHVTPWIRTHKDLVKSSLVGPGGGLETLRWTLDYPEDVAMFRALYEALGSGAASASAADYAALCLRRPDIPRINANRIDPARLSAPDRADVEQSVASLRSAA